MSVLLGMATISVGAESVAVEPPLFETHILPLFKESCLRCHGEKKQRADLDLRTLESLRKGGESGPGLVAGDAAKSRLFELVSLGKMPPKKPLGESQVELIRRWIDAGAPSAEDISAELVATVTEREIFVTMQRRCTVCHGKRVKEADLDLRTRESMLRGGKSGPAIVLGDPDASLLVQRVRSEEMPPLEQQFDFSVRPVTDGELGDIKKWIAAGAPLADESFYESDDGLDRLVTEADRQFWFYRSPRRPQPPTVKDAARVRNAIDAFLLDKLEAANLTYSPEANRATLIRRLTYDLTGLPPSPEEVENYLTDSSDGAYEKVVDRLLASPHYGERWGAHWLDAAGYADSEGKRSADPIRRHAWRYRDYVVRAIGADKPYDEFLIEQIAGDELVDSRRNEDLSAAEVDKLVATGFLRMAPDGTASQPVNFLPERWEVISDEIEVLGSAVMATTFTCAKCHSHKYDPIPQRDYYRLAAIFITALDPYNWLTTNQRYLDMQASALASWTGMHEEANEEIALLESDRDQRTQPIRDRILTERLDGLPESIRDDVRNAQATAVEKRTAVQKYLSEKFKELLTVTNADAVAKAPQLQATVAAADRKIAHLRTMWPAAGKIRALYELGGEPSPVHILRRGDPFLPGERVSARPPAVFSGSDDAFVVTQPWDHDGSAGRRLAFAKWLTRSRHPATARVIVNRLWHHHFGRGIVSTVGNFGHTGARPTHPELLDWLAVELEEQAYSLKAIHRLIITSSAYRQRSRRTPEGQRQDDQNALLARMPVRRLDAESIRDSLLAVADRLDRQALGPPERVERKDDNVVAGEDEHGARRSLYIMHRRKEMLTMLETFDRPQFNPNCLLRRQSVVSSQALQLLNSEFVRSQAAHFAQRVIDEIGPGLDKQIEHIYRLALARNPDSEEHALAAETLADLRKTWLMELAAATGTNVTPDADLRAEAERRALTGLCHTILNSAEFIYID